MTLFAEAGYSYGAAEQRPQEQIEWLASRRLLEPGRVFLDVGCYDGKFLSTLPCAVERIGVDVDASAIARGKERDEDIELYCSAFEIFQPPKRPNVITMFHVLEHLADPKEVLLQLAKISSEDTVLVVEVPTLDRGSTEDINGFFSIQHLTHFSENTLLEMLNSAGWQVTDATNIEDYNGRRLLATKSQTTPPKIQPNLKDCLTLKENLRTWFAGIAKAELRLASLPASAQIIIWGAGIHTELIYQITNFFKANDRRFLIVDNDPLKIGKSWRGVEICPVNSIKNLSDNDTFIIISSYASQENIRDAAIEYGIAHDRVTSLYEKSIAY